MAKSKGLCRTPGSGGGGGLLAQILIQSSYAYRSRRYIIPTDFEDS